MLKWDDRKVHSLNRRPQNPVGLECIKIALFQLLQWTTPFHDGHTRQEATKVDRRKDGLISKNSSCDGGSLVLKNYFLLQKVIPPGGGRSKDSFTKISLSVGQKLKEPVPPP